MPIVANFTLRRVLLGAQLATGLCGRRRVTIDEAGGGARTKMSIRRVLAGSMGIAVVSLLCGISSAWSQTAILGSTSAHAAYVFPNVGFTGACPANVAESPVAGIPDTGFPHGVAYYGRDFALIADFSHSQVWNVQVSTSSVLNAISTFDAGYFGMGTIAVAPNLQYALMSGGASDLIVMQAPFSAPTFTSLSLLPGHVESYQTQGIVFDASSRAYVATSAGIVVLDPPYTTIAFTIPGYAQGIAITPAGDQLLVTQGNLSDPPIFNNNINIYSSPFSDASIPDILTVPGGLNLDGIIVTPDGSRALVTDANARHLVSITAPYNASSNTELISLANISGGAGFEDVSVSADGRFAMATGRSNLGDVALLRAPFTSAGATVCPVPVPGGRGAGAVRFLPGALLTTTTLRKAFVPTSMGNNGFTTLTFTVTNPPGNASQTFGFTDTLPSKLRVASSPNIGGTCTEGTVIATAGGNTISVQGKIAPPGGEEGSSCTITVAVTNVQGQGGTCPDTGLTNGAANLSNVTGIAPDPPVAPTCVSVSASPTLVKSFSAQAIADGGSATLTFTVTNPPNNAAQQFSFVDNLPSSLRIASPTGLLNNCGGSVVPGNGFITVTNAQVGASIFAPTSCTIQVDVTNAPSQTNPSCENFPPAFTNSRANIQNDASLVNLVNGVEPACLVVLNPGQLQVPPSPVDFGNKTVSFPTIPMSIPIFNIGQTNVTVSEVAFLSPEFTNDGSTCTQGAVVVPGGSCQIIAVFTPTDPGQRPGSIEVTSTGVGSPQRVQVVPVTGTGRFNYSILGP